MPNRPFYPSSPVAERTPVGRVVRYVPTCRVDAERADVERLFAAHSAEEIVVLDGDGRPAGVIVPPDLARDGETARGLLSPILLALHASMPMSVAAAIMSDQEIDRIPVVDASRRFLGLLTWVDLISWFEHLPVESRR